MGLRPCVRGGEREKDCCAPNQLLLISPTVIAILQSMSGIFESYACSGHVTKTFGNVFVNRNFMNNVTMWHVFICLDVCNTKQLNYYLC